MAVCEKRECGVSSRKQQHDYARRRYEKWLAHQAAVRARQRRRRIVVGWSLGVLALAAGVWLIVELVRGDPEVVTDADVVGIARTADTAVDDADTPGTVALDLGRATPRAEVDRFAAAGTESTADTPATGVTIEGVDIQ